MKQNLTENGVSLFSNGLNSIPICKKVDVAKLKLDIEQFSRIPKWKWNLEMIREMFLLTHLKQNPLLTLEIREHLLNIFEEFRRKAFEKWGSKRQALRESVCLM